jgi:hypothetical protein
MPVTVRAGAAVSEEGTRAGTTRTGWVTVLYQCGCTYRELVNLLPGQGDEALERREGDCPSDGCHYCLEAHPGVGVDTLNPYWCPNPRLDGKDREWP